MKLRLCTAIWLFSSLFVYSGYSQDAPDSVNVGLQKGSWSLQFGFVLQPTAFQNTLFFDAFDGGILSTKLHVSDNSAFRASLGFVRDDLIENLRTRTEDRDPDNGGFMDSGIRSRDALDLWIFDVSVLYLRYMQATPSLAFYLGAGPGYEFNLDDDFNRNSRGSRDDDTFRTNQSRIANDVWGTGMHLVFGAEWFVTPGLSFIAEYHSKLFYTVTDLTTEFLSVNASGTILQQQGEILRSFSFESQPVRFGVSFYF